jgi:hypothetical protein
VRAIGGWECIIIAVVLLLSLVPLYLFWRVFDKTGMSPWLSLMVLVPGGYLVALAVLAFATWPVGQARMMQQASPPA